MQGGKSGSDSEDEIRLGSYWLKAQHPDGGDEFATVSDIENFNPKDKKDFDPQKKYVLRTSKWTKGESVQRRKVYILRIEETLPKLQASLEPGSGAPRLRIPKLKPRDSDCLTSEAEVEQRKLVTKREAPAVADQLKRKAADADLMELESYMCKRAISSNQKKTNSNDKAVQDGKKDKKSFQKKVGSSVNNQLEDNCLQSNEALPPKVISNFVQNSQKLSEESLSEISVLSPSGLKTSNSEKSISINEIRKSSNNSYSHVKTVKDGKEDEISSGPFEKNIDGSSINSQAVGDNSLQSNAVPITKTPGGKNNYINQASSSSSANQPGRLNALQSKKFAQPSPSNAVVNKSFTTNSKPFSSNHGPVQSVTETHRDNSLLSKYSFEDDSNISVSSSVQSSEILITDSNGQLTAVNFNNAIEEKEFQICELQNKLSHYKKLASNRDQAVMDLLLTIEQKVNHIDSNQTAYDQRFKRIESALQLNDINLSRPRPHSAVVLATRLHLGPHFLSNPSSEVSSGNTPTSAGAIRLLGENKVDLGEGIACSVVAYNTMESTIDLNQWCCALLHGVYGNKASLYRYRIQSKNAGKLRTFSLKFKNVAQVLYKRFLLRVGHKPPFTKKQLNQVLSALSKKARDLNGRRNKSSPKIPKEKASISPQASQPAQLVDPCTGFVTETLEISGVDQISDPSDVSDMDDDDDMNDSQIENST